ncbi:TPA: helix-turn-helix domain-containing protein [Morganella morganii]|uniref:helix-turn-helix domain-containing protein n=1 Tax=Morganella morganii TaxID=582 RepID=UPI00114340B7|nr:helix-turn-helix domain-containing protein [Morganella morganii]QXO71094.1 helix-turn-helix transcriptional regulator [Morganella morganii]HCD1134429.1 helix-turn-helix transcriptional regulator [Morganella morganii]
MEDAMRDQCINKKAGAKIRELRIKNDIPTKVMAEIIGVSPQQLLRYERGCNRIYVNVIHNVRCYFDCSVTFFFS